MTACGPLRAGLTGGIGSGKSTVAAALARRGALVVDTDAIARELTAPGGAALPAIAQAFGSEMIDASGALDRARMRQQVFAQPSTRRQLEAILHPMIGEETRLRAARAAPGQPIVFDVPLLVESAHWRQRVDRVLVVDCDEEEQVVRVIRRSGWTEAEVRRVIAQQATRVQRRQVADAVIVNGAGTALAALDDAARRLWSLWWPGAGV
ncbi:dephospho-CoA kinase [Ideonella sp.]|uniref:dephospho-CoA kinase n=1 Tax=Ideonella sp. TaxID=1929293 RepID=UPI0035B1948A